MYELEQNSFPNPHTSALDCDRKERNLRCPAIGILGVVCNRKEPTLTEMTLSWILKVKNNNYSYVLLTSNSVYSDPWLRHTSHVTILPSRWRGHSGSYSVPLRLEGPVCCWDQRQPFSGNALAETAVLPESRLSRVASSTD